MNSGGGAAAISRTELGVGACGEPVVIGFVARMVRGADVLIQLVKAGSGRLSNESLELIHWSMTGSFAGAPAQILVSDRRQKVSNLLFN
jgi:hypothetical protein